MKNKDIISVFFNSVGYGQLRNNTNKKAQTSILNSFEVLIESASDLKLYNRLYNCNSANNKHFFNYFEQIVFDKIITYKTTKKFISVL